MSLRAFQSPDRADATDDDDQLIGLKRLLVARPGYSVGGARQGERK